MIAFSDIRPHSSLVWACSFLSFLIKATSSSGLISVLTGEVSRLGRDDAKAEVEIGFVEKVSEAKC